MYTHSAFNCCSAFKIIAANVADHRVYANNPKPSTSLLITINDNTGISFLPCVVSAYFFKSTPTGDSLSYFSILATKKLTKLKYLNTTINTKSFTSYNEYKKIMYVYINST